MARKQLARTMDNACYEGWDGRCLQCKDLAPFFDFYVSSEEPEVTRPKPDTKPYLVAMERALPLLSSSSSVSELANEWVHVGDCIDNDVRAAKRAGMRTVFYLPEEGKND